jgi:hypothetical protein
VALPARRRCGSFTLADLGLCLLFVAVLIAEFLLLHPRSHARSNISAPELEPTASFEDDYFAALPGGQPRSRTPLSFFRRAGCQTRGVSSYFLPVEMFRDRWDGQVLPALLRVRREPSLSCGRRRSRDFRFLWQPDLAAGLVIRVTVPDDRAFVPYVLADGLEYDGPLLLERARHELSYDDLQKLTQLLDRANFWQMPTVGGQRGPDGATWVIEARVGSSYHVVERWSPPPGPFRDLGALFVRVASVSRQLY